MQRCYLEGLEADGTISYGDGGGGTGGAEPQFTTREAEIGTDVIDIGAMRRELDEARDRRKRGDR